jgi:uncharacterized protein YbjT (DUF2867 family)
MADTNILLTGATGQVGGAALRSLPGARVLVRSQREIAGAEVAVGSFDDPDSLHRALDGIDVLFLTGRDNPDQVAQHLRVLEVAAARGVSHVVKLSAIGARPDSPVALMRWHAAIETALRESPFTWTFVRPHLYMQNLLRFAGAVAPDRGAAGDESARDDGARGAARGAGARGDAALGVRASPMGGPGAAADERARRDAAPGVRAAPMAGRGTAGGAGARGDAALGVRAAPTGGGAAAHERARRDTASGVLAAPMGDGTFPLVDTRDVGAAVAAVVRDPGAHAGATYSLTGPEAVGYAEVAAALAELVGAPVRYEALEPAAFRAGLLEAGVPEWRADDLAAIASAYTAADNAPTGDLAALLGRPPTPLRQFLTDHRETYLAGASRSHL